MQSLIISLEEMDWQSHPLNECAQVKRMVSQADEAKVSILLVKIPKGEGIPEHVHEHSSDILFTLSGVARMSVEGLEEIELKEGMLVAVPPDTRHRIFDVKEELLLYDVFVPPLAP
jgi:quercetin dioxygenase-like cupin family protein